MSEPFVPWRSPILGYQWKQLNIMAEPIPCFAEYGYLGGLRIKILMVKKKKKKRMFDNTWFT